MRVPVDAIDGNAVTTRANDEERAPAARATGKNARASVRSLPTEAGKDQSWTQPSGLAADRSRAQREG